MDGTIVPLSPGRHQGELQEIGDLCVRSKSPEELFLWITGQRRIIVSRNPDWPVPAIGLSFLVRDTSVALVNVATPELVASLPGFRPLNEQTLNFSDQEGYRPDDEWFDERNDRLGLYDHADFGLNFAPPSAFLELMLSYALSSAGFAEISAVTESCADGQIETLQASLVFLGIERGRGWHETTGFFRRDFIQFLSNLFWA